MPEYRYRCLVCGMEHGIWVPKAEPPDEVYCPDPKCKSRRQARIFDATPSVFAGGKPSSR